MDEKPDNGVVFCQNLLQHFQSKVEDSCQLCSQIS